MIGLSTEDSQDTMIKPLGSFNDASVANLTDEVVQFNVPCPNCNKMCDTNMKVTGILFKKYYCFKLKYGKKKYTFVCD